MTTFIFIYCPTTWRTKLSCCPTITDLCQPSFNISIWKLLFFRHFDRLIFKTIRHLKFLSVLSEMDVKIEACIMFSYRFEYCPVNVLSSVTNLVPGAVENRVHVTPARLDWQSLTPRSLCTFPVHSGGPTFIGSISVGWTNWRSETENVKYSKTYADAPVFYDTCN